MPGLVQHLFAVRDYDLAATLTSGQAFRWEERPGGWEAVVAQRWVRLRQVPEGILAQSQKLAVGSWQLADPSDLSDWPPPPATWNSSWAWLADYLQVNVDLQAVVATFPDDPPLGTAVSVCRGLRLLRQEPWECLASFLLSSTKQIVQIAQIIRQLCQSFGEKVAAPAESEPAYAFPSAARLAACDEASLRACKMGFRAPYLLRTARLVASGEINLQRLPGLPLEQARQELLRLPGVGRKIADCVLLFACGHAEAFPVDVWILKALRQLYFPQRQPTARELQSFADAHFGPHAGYAQQYLFHFMRQPKRNSKPAIPNPKQIRR